MRYLLSSGNAIIEFLVFMEHIVISGVTSGFGVNWLYELDRTKEAVFLVLARDEVKFNALIEDKPLANKVHFIHCDLDSFKSIDRAVESIKAVTKSVDALINNAGVFSSEELCLSQDGIELTLAVNQLAPYLLVGKLLPLLKNAGGGRVINTASFRHSDAKIDLDDIELRNNFNAEIAYCNSKLYTVLLTKKLAELFEGSQVQVNCFDPGIVNTPMLSIAFPKSLKFIYPLFSRFIARSPEKGAETGVYLTCSPKVESITGKYFKDCKVKAPHKLADAVTADWLWLESERLTGFKY